MITAMHILGLRHIGMHRLRSLLAAGGIAAGVGGLISTQLVHEAFIEAYERTVRTVSDGADLQISNGDVGVPEELLESVQAIPGVASAAAAVRGVLALRNGHQEKLYLHGIDLLAGPGPEWREASSTQVTVEDPIEFISDPESVAVTATTARQYGWTLGSHLRVRAPSGARRLTVRAVFEATEGPAGLLGERLLVMDVLAAQRLMGMEGRVSQIDITVLANVDVAAVEEKVAEMVRDRARVGRSAASGKAVERLLGSYRHGLTVGAGLCLIAALYVVINAMVVSVAQRQREFGVLRVVGMTRGQVRALIAVEALALGALGCIAGVPLGLWLAQLSAAAGVQTMSTLYLTIGDPVIRLHPKAVACGLATALLVAGAAAAAAGCQVVRRHTLELVRGESRNADGSRTYRYAEFAGAGLLGVAGVTCVAGHWAGGGTRMLGVTAFLSALLGMALMVPASVRILARRADRPLESSLGPIGLLASRAIASELGSVALACSALLASLAGTLAFAGLVTSLEVSLATGLRTAFSNVDLIVTSGAEPLSEDGAPIPEAVVDEIGALHEVSYVDPIRVMNIPYKGSLAALVASDGSLVEEGRHAVEFIADDRVRAVAALARGEGVFVTQTFARRFEHRIGDTISLPTPTGLVKLLIVGIYLFEASVGDIGAIRLDRRLYQRYWLDRAASLINVTLVEGADAARASRQIQRRMGRRRDLFVVTAKELRDQYHAVLTRLSGLLKPMIAAACLVGSLGLIAGRLTSVEGRRRLFVILRAIGATRKQRAAMLVTESTVIGLMTAVLASLAGSVLGYLEVTIILREVCGIDIPYTHPTAVMVSVLVGAPAIASVSGYWQERFVTRGGCADALHYA